MIGKDAKKSRAPFIIGILAVCLAGAAFGAVKFLERSLVNRFNEAAARIPASYGLSIGEVAGNAFSRSVTLKRVALRIPETNFSVSMDNATIAGLSFSGNSGDGPDTLADELTITNLQIAGGYVTSSSEYLSITGFKSNLPKLAANWQESVEGSARFLEQLARTALVNGPPAPVTKKNEKMPALHLFAERYVSRGDRFRIERDGNVLEAFSGSTEAGDLSPEAFGPMLYKDIWVAYNGRRFLAIREAGFDGGAFPPESDAPQDASDVVLGRNPFGDDFRLKKAVLRDA
ncbi:MAG: hypothetical protein LIP28_06260, partial [Deltaproteobacteria bacterium]|nr:hypothetical protein [Deltaproteobacteria bacterium]